MPSTKKRVTAKKAKAGTGAIRKTPKISKKEKPPMDKCSECGSQLVVYEAGNPDKPLRCSDSCTENRKSIRQRTPAESEDDE